MNRKRILSSGLVAAASFSMLAACSPTETPTTPGSPMPSASPSDVAPTATPSDTPSVEPTDEPSTEPSATPTASAVPSTEPSASVAPTASPSATLPPNEDDISVVERTTFNGKVFDDTNAPLDGVLVTAKSLNSSVAYEVQTTTAGGTYAFNNAPAGIQIEITASRSGYTTRRRVEVLKSNKQGDPDANRYDFGTDGSTSGSFGVQYNALSDKPEVTVVTPGRNAAGVDPATSFVLKFSEPMDRKTVIDNFEVRAYTTETFSVDDDTTVTGSAAITSTSGTRIWDKAAFNASWNSDDTEVTMSFKEERMLPTDKDSDKTPDYQVSFKRQDSQLKDKSGITRASEYFKLTDGNFEETYKFSINTDETKPTLSSLVAQTAENSGANSDGDAIKVRFSERMIHYTLGPTIAGGMNNVASQAAGANGNVTGEQAAANYKVTVIRSGNTMLNQATWSSLGGRAIFDTNDPTHKTVLLLPKKVNGTAAGKTYGSSLTGTATGINIGTGNQTMTLGLYNFSTGADVTITTADINGGTAAADEATVATALQTALNAAAPAGVTFSVVASNGTPDSLTISFTDTDGATNGQFSGIRFDTQVVQAGDVLPSTYTIANQVAFDAAGNSDLYRPGDNVIVMADTTILDPAGNSVDSSGDDASANAS